MCTVQAVINPNMFISTYVFDTYTYVLTKETNVPSVLKVWLSLTVKTL